MSTKEYDWDKLVGMNRAQAESLVQVAGLKFTWHKEGEVVGCMLPSGYIEVECKNDIVTKVIEW